MIKKLFVILLMCIGSSRAMESGILQEYLNAREADKLSSEASRPAEKAFLDRWLNDKACEEKAWFLKVLIETAVQFGAMEECRGLVFMHNKLLARIPSEVRSRYIVACTSWSTAKKKAAKSRVSRGDNLGGEADIKHRFKRKRRRTRPMYRRPEWMDQQVAQIQADELSRMIKGMRVGSQSEASEDESNT